MYDSEILTLIDHIASVVRGEGYLVGEDEPRTLNIDCFNIKLSRSFLGWQVDLDVCDDILAATIGYSLKDLTFYQPIELTIKVGSKIAIRSLKLKLSNSMTTTITNLSDYQKELQDRKGAIFGVCLVQDRNLAVSPEAIELMGVSENELLSRNLCLYWQKKDIAYDPTIICKPGRPKGLREFIETLKQQSHLENHSYPGWKNNVWGIWTANIKVREIAPFHFVREHEALDFLPTI